MYQLLDLDGDGTATVATEKGSWWSPPRDANAIYSRLTELDDDAVMRILAFVTAETLPCGAALVESLGERLDVDMAECWQPDDTFFDLLRDKAAINAMLAEVAGETVAAGNLTAPAKVQKGIIRDYLNGTRQPQQSDWLPRYMTFPIGSYKKCGSIGAIDKHGNDDDRAESEQREAA